MTIDEMILVLQASKEGKKIEAKSRISYDSKWGTPHLYWDFHNFDYRVKPEPMEIEAWVHPTEKNIYRADRITAAEKDFIDYGWTKKKFREVIE